MMIFTNCVRSYLIVFGVKKLIMLLISLLSYKMIRESSIVLFMAVLMCVLSFNFCVFQYIYFVVRIMIDFIIVVMCDATDLFLINRAQ